MSASSSLAPAEDVEAPQDAVPPPPPEEPELTGANELGPDDWCAFIWDQTGLAEFLIMGKDITDPQPAPTSITTQSEKGKLIACGSKDGGGVTRVEYPSAEAAAQAAYEFDQSPLGQADVGEVPATLGGVDGFFTYTTTDLLGTTTFRGMATPTKEFTISLFISDAITEDSARTQIDKIVRVVNQMPDPAACTAENYRDIAPQFENRKEELEWRVANCPGVVIEDNFD